MRSKTRESGLLYQLRKMTRSRLNILIRENIARQLDRPRTRKSINVVIKENRKHLVPTIFGYGGGGRLQVWCFSFTKYKFRQSRRESRLLASLQ